jgi:hypothetical protein
MKVHSSLKAPPKVRRPLPLRPILAVALLLAIVALGWFVALPSYIHTATVRAFASKGVRADISRPSVRWGRVHFDQAKLRFDGREWLRADLTDIDVALDGLTPQSLRAADAQLFVEAPLSAVPEEAGPRPPIPISLANASVRWTAPASEVSQADVLGLTVEMLTSGDIDAQNGKLSLATAKGPMGPWDLTYAHRADSDRITVAFDGPRARWLRVRDARQTMLHFTSEASKPSTWKIPNLPSWMASTEPRIEAMLTEPKGGLTTGHVEIRVSDVKVAPLPRALDLAVLLNISEMPLPKKRTYQVDRGTLALGNIVGGLAGTMVASLSAPTADLTGTFRGVPCTGIAADLAPSEAARMLGGLAQGFGVDAGTFEADARIKLTAGAAPDFSFTVRRACLPLHL